MQVSESSSHLASSCATQNVWEACIHCLLLRDQGSGKQQKMHVDMHHSSLHDASLHTYSVGPQAKRLLEAILAMDKKGLLVRLALVSLATCCTSDSQYPRPACVPGAC